MATTTELKESIAQIVKTNGNNEITGQLLQNVLFSMIDNGTLTGTVYNLSKITNVSYSTRAAARAAAVQQQQITFAYGDILMYKMDGNVFVREMALTNAVSSGNTTWLDLSMLGKNRSFTFRGNSIICPLYPNNNILQIVVDGELYFDYEDTVFVYRDGTTNVLTPTIDINVTNTSIVYIVATLDRATSSFAIQSIDFQNIKTLMDGKERVVIGAALKNNAIGSGANTVSDEMQMVDIPGLNELFRELPPRMLRKTLDFDDIIQQGLIDAWSLTGDKPKYSIVNDASGTWIEATFKAGVNQSIVVGKGFSGFAQLSMVINEPISAKIIFGTFTSSPKPSFAPILEAGQTGINAPVYFFNNTVVNIGILGADHTEDITLRFRINIVAFTYDAETADNTINQKLGIDPINDWTVGGNGLSLVNKGGGALELIQTAVATGYIDSNVSTDKKPYYLETKLRIKDADIAPSNFNAGGAGLTFAYADSKLTLHQTAAGTGFIEQSDVTIDIGKRFIMTFDARILSGTEQLIFAGYINSSATTGKQLIKLTPTLQHFELILTSDADATFKPGFYIDGSQKQVGVDIEITNFSISSVSQNVRVGIIASGTNSEARDIEVSGDWKTYLFKLNGISVHFDNEYNPGITILNTQSVVGNVIEVEYFKIAKYGSVGYELYESQGGNPVNLNYDYPVTSRTEAFLQSVSRADKYLTRIACEGDSLIANEIGGAIPAEFDEGDTMRPMRLLTNGVPRRLYDFLSWNRPTWRRLDNAAWTLSGFAQFTEGGLFEGTPEKYWNATTAGAYVEITIPDGMEHFALVARTKAGYGKLNVTLNGGAIGTYPNPYWDAKVATNRVVNSSVVPQNVPRGVSQIDLNFGVSGTGNPYAVFEFNNLPAGDNVLRFTTNSATRVDVWGGFYWSGNTCVVMNIAHGGHTTSDLINQNLTDELYNAGYDAVLFEVTEMNNTRLTLNQTEADLRAIIDRLREIDIDYCFTSCNPLGLSIVHDTNFYTNLLNPSQFEINERTRKVMNELNAPFVDLFQYFSWHIANRGGSLLGGEGGLWYTWDGQHGNPAGVKIWFDCLKKIMTNKPLMFD